LPNQWLWDIVDEFIYQYQSFSLFRDRVVRAQQAEDGDAEEDIHQLFAVFRDHPQVWNTYAVLNILYSLVSKSNIQQQLRALKAGQDVAHVAGEFGHANIYKMLGYFGLVGLVRLHCIMGDYALALNTLADVDLTKRVAMARATSCHVSTYYYVGFSYMMLGRYADAVRTFSHILIFINRAKQYNPRTYQYDQMNKLADKMHALLTICISLAPMRLDESIHSQIRDKFTESLTRMQRADLDALQAYNELFIYACPRYIAPMAVGLDSDTPVPDRSAFQARIFVSNVERQLRIPILRSFLKLYTTLGVERLASFLEMEEDELMTLLLLFKQTTRQTKWNEGLLLDEGERTLVSDLDCSINVDTVIIAESKMGRRFGDWFLRNSSKFHDLQVSVQKTAAKAQ
jgi:translation initiation factor 3 subunit L